MKKFDRELSGKVAEFLKPLFAEALASDNKEGKLDALLQSVSALAQVIMEERGLHTCEFEAGGLTFILQLMPTDLVKQIEAQLPKPKQQIH